MDLLEGALYGMDLLKLHSVTTKLLARVENIEKVNVLQSSHYDTFYLRWISLYFNWLSSLHENMGRSEI